MGLFARKPNLQRMIDTLDTDGLVKASGHRNSEVRREAVCALGMAESEAGLRQLIWCLRHDEDPKVRVEAVRALERQPSSRVMKHVAKALDDQDTRVREEAEEALRRIERRIQAIDIDSQC